MAPMLGVRALLMLTLGGFGAVFTALWGRDIARKRARGTADRDEASRDSAEASATRAGLPSLAQAAIEERGHGKPRQDDPCDRGGERLPDGLPAVNEVGCHRPLRTST